MAKLLDMPKLSPTMEEGVLTAWHKKAGDAVKVDDLLAEVETDKATMEFRSFDNGTLLKLLVPPGSTVKLGQPVAIIGNAGEDTGALEKSLGQSSLQASSVSESSLQASSVSQGSPQASSVSQGSLQASSVSQGSPQASSVGSAATAPAVTAFASDPGSIFEKGDPLSRTERAPNHAPPAARAGGTFLASPHIRKTARERGIDLGGAVGSGPHGRIEIEDLARLGAMPQGLSKPTSNGGAALAPASYLAAPELRPNSPMRKTIARRLTESKQTVPHFYLTIDVDAEPLLAFREEINRELAEEKLAEGDKPLKVSVNDVLVKACAAALRRVPECNASFTSDAILVHRRVDISVAVAIPDGLVTPVLRDADKKTLVELAREVRDLAARARAKKLRPEEMSEGTFSISNLGMFGIDAFSAVINPPEGAILAVGQARDTPVVRKRGTETLVVPGKMLALTLSCDHRVVDGAVGAAFLAELRSLLGRPMRILTG